MNGAVAWQRVEGALVFLGALALVSPVMPVGVPWYVWVLLILAPDLSFLGYLAGPRIGAIVYNAAHVYGLGAVLLAVGLAAGAPFVATTGALWLAHSGIDRALGYGLKLPEGFKRTHLGDL